LNILDTTTSNNNVSKEKTTEITLDMKGQVECIIYFMQNISDYTKLVKILLYFISNCNDQLIQLLCVEILNSNSKIAEDQKKIAGSLDVVSNLIILINTKLQNSSNKGTEQLIEQCWAAMWNLTGNYRFKN